MHRLKLAVFAIVTVFGWFSFGAQAASAASFYFVPSSGPVKTGATFTVGVFVSSPDQAMNAAQGTINFSRDTVEVVGISKTNSIVKLWLQEPSYSNSSGTINFEGILFNPGYQGTAGKILALTLKAKAPGTGSLSMSAGSILANDGKGTNILTSLPSAKYSISGTLPPPPPKPPAPAPIPPPVAPTTPRVPLAKAPVISSDTHPDHAAWYSDAYPKFKWPVPVGITGVSYIFDQATGTVPPEKSAGLFSSYNATGVENGTWYFHLRFQNDGGFGAVGHFKVQVDTMAPSRFEIKRSDSGEPGISEPEFTFDASDAMSGIANYEIAIDGGPQTTWLGSASQVYKTPKLKDGEHILMAKAIDRAGNSLSTSIGFAIGELLTPILKKYPKNLDYGDPLEVIGVTSPNTLVMLRLVTPFEEHRSWTVRSTNLGTFTFNIQEKFVGGSYTMWAEVSDKEETRTVSSEKVRFTVQATVFAKVGAWIVTVWPWILLILLLLLIVWGLYTIRNKFGSSFHAVVMHVKHLLPVIGHKQGYCMKCRTIRTVKDIAKVSVKDASGVVHEAMQGVCSVCGSKMSIITKTDHEEITPNFLASITAIPKRLVGRITDLFVLRNVRAYCVKCRQVRPISHPVKLKMMDESGVLHESVKGICSVCGTKMSNIMKNGGKKHH